MAEKIALELDIDTKGATTTLGQLEQEAERLNEELRKVPLGSKAFKDLKSELIGVNKQIKNTELSMEALDNEQVASELGSVAGAVGDVSSAFILLGGSGGTLEETVQNIEKAIGVSMAFKGAIEGVASGRKLLNNIIKNSTALQKGNLALTKATTIANKALGLSTDTATKSFKLMRGALIATGIGALVVLIGTLIANWDKVTKALGTTTEAQQAYNDATAKAIDSIGKELDAADKLQKTLKDDTRTREEKVQAVKDLQKEYPGLLDNVDAEKDGLIAVSEQLTKNIELITIKAQLEALAELRQEKTKENLKLIVDAQTGVNVGLTDYAAALSLGVSGQEFANFATTKAIAENKKYQEGIDGLTESLKIKMKVAIEGGAVDAEMIAEEAERLKELEKLEKEAAANAKKRADAAAKRAKRLADEEAKAKKEADDLMFAARKEINNRRVIEEIETNNKLKEEEKSTLETLSGFYKAYYDKQREEQQKELERQIALEDAKLSLAADGVAALINLTTAFAKDNEKSQKRAFEINKRLQIAQAIIQTYQGANAIFASAAANPATVLFPAQPFIAAGIAIANGLANVATISKQQFQSSSPGGGGRNAPDFSGGGGTAPQLSPVTNTSTIVPQGPTQVFVTETDITNTQNQVNVIQGQATLS